MSEPFTITMLRDELGLTQLAFGERIGLANKASVSLIERGLAPISLRVALAIEELSAIDGTPRIDAATLNEDVRLSRHGAADAPESPSPSPDSAACVIGATHDLISEGAPADAGAVPSGRTRPGYPDREPGEPLAVEGSANQAPSAAGHVSASTSQVQA